MIYLTERNKLIIQFFYVFRFFFTFIEPFNGNSSESRVIKRVTWKIHNVTSETFNKVIFGFYFIKTKLLQFPSLSP